MKKLAIFIDVDEELLRIGSNALDENIETMVEREMAWLRPSGIVFAGVIGNVVDQVDLSQQGEQKKS